MKKILFINDLASGGGAENVLQNVANYLVAQNNEVTIFTLFYDANFYNYYSNKIKYIYNYEKDNKKKLLFTRALRKLYKLSLSGIIKIKKYDVVIAMKEGPSAILASKFKAEKKFAWIHVDYNYLYWTKDIFNNKQEEVDCFKKFNRVVCVSEATKDSVKKVIGDPGNLCVKYNPLNVENIIQKSKESIEIKYNEGKILFVAIGRLAEQKNFSMLLDAVISLKSKRELFELWIIGDGPEREKLEEKIALNNLSNVKLLGNKDNPYAYMRKADWVVSSAIWESFGLTIQESLILNIPVIATKCPAIEEVCDPKATILVENDVESLALAMKNVMDDRNIRKRYVDYLENHDAGYMWKGRIDKILELWKG